MTTRITVEMDEDLLKMIDNMIEIKRFEGRDEAINYYVKHGMLVMLK